MTLSCIEIATFIVTLIGVFIAAYVAIIQISDIKRQQKIIARQLSSKPELTVGLTDPSITLSSKKPRLHRTHSYQAIANDPLHKTVSIQITIRNSGELTASNILFNFKVTKNVQIPAINFEKISDDKYNMGVINSVSSKGLSPINPGDSIDYMLSFVVPNDINSFKIWATVSMFNSPEISTVLTVRLN